MTYADLQALAERPSLTEPERDSIMCYPEAKADFDPVTRLLIWWPPVQVGTWKWIEQPVDKPKVWEQRSQARSTYYRNLSRAQLSRRIRAYQVAVQELLDQLEAMEGEGDATENPPPSTPAPLTTTPVQSNVD